MNKKLNECLNLPAADLTTRDANKVSVRVGCPSVQPNPIPSATCVLHGTEHELCVDQLLLIAKLMCRFIVIYLWADKSCTRDDDAVGQT